MRLARISLAESVFKSSYLLSMTLFVNRALDTETYSEVYNANAGPGTQSIIITYTSKIRWGGARYTNGPRTEFRTTPMEKCQNQSYACSENSCSPENKTFGISELLIFTLIRPEASFVSLPDDRHVCPTLI